MCVCVGVCVCVCVHVCICVFACVCKQTTLRAHEYPLRVKVSLGPAYQLHTHSCTIEVALCSGLFIRHTNFFQRIKVLCLEWICQDEEERRVEGIAVSSPNPHIPALSNSYHIVSIKVFKQHRSNETEYKQYNEIDEYLL